VLTNEGANMSLLPRFKSNKKIQAAALDILTEMIHREQLNVSVAITDPSISLHCWCGKQSSATK
jgi:hypothetical protein